MLLNIYVCSGYLPFTDVYALVYLSILLFYERKYVPHHLTLHGGAVSPLFFLLFFSLYALHKVCLAVV